MAAGDQHTDMSESGSRLAARAAEALVFVGSRG